MGTLYVKTKHVEIARVRMTVENMEPAVKQQVNANLMRCYALRHVMQKILVMKEWSVLMTSVRKCN